MDMSLQYCFNYFTPRIPEFSRLLADFRGQPDVSFLEIGAFEGLSAAWFLYEILSGAGASLTCIDPWVYYPELLADEAKLMEFQAEAHFDYNTSWAVAQSGASLIKCKGTAEMVLPTLLTNSFQMVYIDGSHRSRDVLADMVLSWRLLSDNGLLLCDDYDYHRFLDPLWSPRPAIDAFLYCYQGFYELLQKNRLVVIRKREQQGRHQPRPTLTPC